MELRNSDVSYEGSSSVECVVINVLPVILVAHLTVVSSQANVTPLAG